jgi:hypothetical protein
VDAFQGETGCRGTCERGVLPQEVADAETRERLATAIAEERLGRRRVESRLHEKRAQDLRSPRKEGAVTFLAALAANADLEGPDELEVPWSDVEDLLHAASSVEHHEEERSITTSVRGHGVGSAEHRADFVFLEVVDDAKPSPLEGHGQQSLAHLEMLRMLGSNEASEGMDGG